VPETWDPAEFDERALVLRCLPGFERASREALLDIAESCVLRRFSIGTVLVEEGSRSGGLYVLASGYVSLWRGKGKQAVCVGEVCPGELFGHVGAAFWGQAELTCQAESELCALEIPQWRFRELVAANEFELASPIRAALVVALARAVRRREERVARLLVDAGAGEPPGQEPRVPPPVLEADHRRSPEPSAAEPPPRRNWRG